MDDNLIIILSIFGEDVLSGNNKVGAEILKPAKPPINLTFRGKQVTNFKKKCLLSEKPLDKVYISDLVSFLGLKK